MRTVLQASMAQMVPRFQCGLSKSHLLPENRLSPHKACRISRQHPKYHPKNFVRVHVHFCHRGQWQVRCVRSANVSPLSFCSVGCPADQLLMYVWGRPPWMKILDHSRRPQARIFRQMRSATHPPPHITSNLLHVLAWSSMA